MDFDPVLVAKLNEKKFTGPCSPASSLLSEHRVRTIIENARELLKVPWSLSIYLHLISLSIALNNALCSQVIDEFGSFDSYCWGLVSNKPLIGRFRHMREVPLRTAKADVISQDLMRRGLRGVGPTVVYAFMQAVGMANDHLVTCYRFEECCTTTAAAVYDGNGDKPAAAVSDQEVSMVCGLVQCVGLEPPRAATVISIS
jgi:DNA-3-methyladenine glycosylase I